VDQQSAFNPDGITPIQVLAFQNITTEFGEPMGSGPSNQIAPLAQGITGFTNTGLHFNSSGSTADNPFVYSLAFFSTAVTATNAIQYFDKSWTIPFSQVGYFAQGPMQGVDVYMHGKMLMTNSSGGSVTISPVLTLTDAIGTLVLQDTRGFTLVTGITAGAITFDFHIKIEYGATPAAPTYDVSGTWLYDDQVSNTSWHTFGGGGNARGAGALNTGVELQMGVQFGSTTASAGAQLTDLSIWVNTPSSDGIFHQ